MLNNKEGGSGILVYALRWCVNVMINKVCQKCTVVLLYNLLFRCEANMHCLSWSTRSDLCFVLSSLGQKHPTESSIVFLSVT